MAGHDYTHHTHAALVQRVTDLEAQLRRLTSHPSTPTPTPPPPKKKPRKPASPFDPSRYHTRLIALKFAYLGSDYNGFEHHANNTTPLPTVEEELWKALRKTRLIAPEFPAGKKGRCEAVGEGEEEEEVCWEGCEYSKCGRTDRGVSAFGQVVGVRVRSSQPKAAPVHPNDDREGSDGESGAAHTAPDEPAPAPPPWHPVRDELPYLHTLNRVLPPAIRLLAWCPDPPPNFSARFNCKERRYRYFFTNPAFASSSSSRRSREGRLDVARMRDAARRLEGLHDFRNLCKVDPSKQLATFERRVFHAGIHRHAPTSAPAPASSPAGERSVDVGGPELYYFEVRGSAFLWHQVRHMAAVLFLVGQGYEEPGVVDQLLDVASCAGKPVYDMAEARPLVLWDCVFPDAAAAQQAGRDHCDRAEYGGGGTEGYTDALEWVYAGDEAGGRDPEKAFGSGVEEGKYGRNGVMDDIWALWQRRKMDEVLAGGLLDVVAQMGRSRPDVVAPAAADGEETGGGMSVAAGRESPDRSDRVFDGGERPRTVG
ncbi:pseudouridine synthase deg1, partial [Teratosphaeriaceae sp. CCFEE 6253]